MLREVTVPPGKAGLDVVWAALDALMQRDSSPMAFVPADDGTDVTRRVRAAMAFGEDEGDLEGIAALIATSGSTGHPRGVMFTSAALTAHTHGPDFTWIAALPLTSIGGLNVVLRGLAHGRRPIPLESLGGAMPFTADALATAIRSAHGAPPAVALVPTQLARCLADRQASAALADCASILIGGARLPGHLRQACADSGISVTTTYGATETAGGCVWDGSPLPDVVITIDDAGCIFLNGPMLASGYRADRAATARAFTELGYRTDDLGHFDSHGKLEVIGRADDVVTITGVNVSVAAVEDVIAAASGVRECAVSIVDPDAHTPALCAWVVADDLTPDRLRSAVQEALGKPAVPRDWRFVSELPHLPNGKVDRQALGHHGNHH